MWVNTGVFEKWSWLEVEECIGQIRMRFLLPYSLEKVLGDGQNHPDLRESTIVNHGVSGTPFLEQIWSGTVQRTGTSDKGRQHYLMISRIATLFRKKELGGKRFGFQAKMLRGRPGFPASVLIDAKGRIVPSLYFQPNTAIRVLFLDRDFYPSYNWRDENPIIGLQFAEGEHFLPGWRLALWDFKVKFLLID